MSAESLTTPKSSALGREHFAADTFLLLIIYLIGILLIEPWLVFFFSLFNAEGLPIYFQQGIFLKSIWRFLLAAQMHLPNKQAEWKQV